MSMFKLLVTLFFCAAAIASAGELPVNLLEAENYVILSKSGISSVPHSAITGNIAVSPITGDAMTGFNLLYGDNTKTYKVTPTGGQITGRAYGSNYNGDTPSKLTTAVGSMETAYTNAAGRPNVDASRINYGGGIIGENYGGATNPLTPGVYTFGSNVQVSDLVFDGEFKDNPVFIIQVTGYVVQIPYKNVVLKNGAKAENIFWQVAGYFAVRVGAHMEGVILGKTHVVFETGSSLNGRIYAQTVCALQMATITEP
jgi:hypothetical protein